ncbi:MAG: HNH endonuclease, partial [bacterium]
MKNLKPYNNDCFAVHKSAVLKKDEGDLKKRLLKLDSEVEKEYKKFDAMFALNQIETLTPNSTLQASKDDLLTLYNYQSAVIRKVRENIRSQQIQTITSTCQNCTIDSINSLDHILPKSKYPEFVVNPKNLFPCCATCNSKKLNSVGKPGGQQFLNLYLDQLPNVQYLFVNITLDKNGDFDFTFHLNNVGGQVDKKVFALIQNHYT